MLELFWVILFQGNFWKFLIFLFLSPKFWRYLSEREDYGIYNHYHFESEFTGTIVNKKT